MAKTTTVSNIKEALNDLGVTETTLRPEEKKALDEQGYLILKNELDRAGLEQLRAAFERLSEQKRSSEGLEGSQERGTRHLSEAIYQDPVFEQVYTNPKLLAAVYHILKRDFKLMVLAGRDPLPGFGQQGLHADAVKRAPSEPFQVVNSLWMLDDFTVESGATRLVPGTHLQLQLPDKKLLAPTREYPNQILAIAPAGSVLIFNAHLWHSGTLNHSQPHRRVINCFFAGRENRQIYNPKPERPETLSPAVRYLLDA